ncbi:putative integral membrane protein [Diaporthe ampelina]|uniref:Putative integral membrane protein n=1 Tax=Diaporthe ampelina TaxID=1214573 RepID=A0A0G2FR69_9PEZI|nr:putative integral membrane protein [Diaporthe ampelina]
MAESQGPTVTTVSVVFGVITILTMALRLFARIYITRSFGPDDGEPYLLAWAFIIATILAVNHGLGSHMEEVMLRGTDNLISYSQIVWLSSIFYNACLGFIKTSVLALYARLGDRELRRLAFVIIGVVACQAGANVIVCIFQCTPVQAAYNLNITNKKCININAFYLANAAVNISTDFLTYTLPIKMVSKLQMPKRQKIGLGVMMSLGFFACLSSIIRITYIPQMLEPDADATWVISGAMHWSAIEITVGILAASIPSFKALAKRYAPALLGSSNRGGSDYKLGGRNHSMGVSRSLSTNKLSRFHVMDKSRSGREVDIQGGVDGVDDRIGGGGGHHDDSAASRARHVQGGGPYSPSENSSEEAVYLKRQPPPQGKIGVRTDIATFYEDA